MVMATEFWRGSTGRGLADGFRALGWAVTEVDVGTFTLAARSLAGRVAARVVARQLRADYNAAILAAVKDIGASAFVTVKGGGIDVATLDRLRAARIRTLNYYPDVEFDHGGLGIAQIAAYDFVATTKSFHTARLNATVGADRRALIQHGFDPAVHRPLHVPSAEDDFDHDVAFVGNASAYKAQWLNAVAALLPGVRLTVAGNRWAGLIDASNIVLLPAAIGDAYARILSRSRISIALHHGPVKTPGWEDLVSTRTFEIPACVGFMLHIDNAEVRTLFEPGREIAVFDTPATLARQIAHYLAHPDERRAIAAAGHARAVPAYSLSMRAAEIARVAGLD